MELVPVKSDSALKEAGIPFTRKTLYSWHSRGRHSELFVRLGGSLFVDVEAFRRWVAKAKKIKRQVRIHG